MSDNETTGLEKLKSEQSKERKALQAQIASLKHAITKNDKKRKKEVAAQIEAMESDLNKRHAEQILELEQALISTTIGSTLTSNTDENKESKNAEGTSLNETNKARKPTKAQLRREKKSEQIQRRAETALIDSENAVTSKANVETETLKNLLLQKKLKIFHIPPDGDCLYNALAHQLNLQADNDTYFNGAELRRIAADYIRTNSEDFRPFLCRNNGDLFDDDEFAEYCNTSVEKTSSDGGEWGGDAELRAISCALKCRIEVIQAEGSSTIFEADSTNKDTKTLTLTYHIHAYMLGEHYNSTIKLCREEIDENKL